MYDGISKAAAAEGIGCDRFLTRPPNGQVERRRTVLDDALWSRCEDASK